MNRQELRQAILSASDITIDPVPTPEWPAVNGHVYVRSLTLPERTRYLSLIRSTVMDPTVQSNQNGDAAKTAIDIAGVKLAVMALCSAEGESLMEEADIAVLAK